jgi:transposase
MRHALSDAQWRLIEPLMPANDGPGGQWKDHRLMFDAMLWRLRTGAPWRDLPERFGPWQTVYDRFRRWRTDGTLDRILEALQLRLDRQGRLDWDLWCVDGTSIRAARAAAGAGEKGAKPSRPTTLWAAAEAGSAASCTWLLTAAECRSRRK